VTNEGEKHPLMSLSQDPAENREWWRQVPPFMKMIKAAAVKPQTVTLATHPTEKLNQSAYCPVFAVRQAGKGKVFMTIAYPLWRWRFVTVGSDMANAQRFDRFVGNTVRWLVTTDEAKRFKISTNKKIYKAGELVELKAQLYDAQLQPLNGAGVEVTVRDQNTERKAILNSAGEVGLYRAEINDLPVGSYRMAGQAFINNQMVAADTGKFFIDDYSLEYEDSRMRQDILERVALKSGGRYALSSDYQHILDTLALLPPEKIKKEKQIDLWDNWYALALFIFLLAAEWTIRKRKGML